MVRFNFRSVDRYIAAQPQAVRALLKRVRGVIRKTLPGAEEIISYQIPAYRLPGGVVLYFAGWKEHYSLYPATASVVAALKDELAACGAAVGRGTIRFPLSRPIPVRLITSIAKLRAAEVAERAGARGAAAKKAEQGPRQARRTK